MTLKVINKINGRLSFLYKKTLPCLKRLLCNAIISDTFWLWLFSLIHKPEKIGIKKFEQINWLPLSEWFKQYNCSNPFKIFTKNRPLFLHDLYKPSAKDQINTGSSILELKDLPTSTYSGQNKSSLTHILEQFTQMLEIIRHS